MCKVLIMPSIENPVLAKLFMGYMAVPMSKSNSHGIGYAAIDQEGNLFSERWYNNYSFLDYETIMTPEIAKKLKKFEARLPYGSLETNYKSHGNVNLENALSVIMHTRFATCEKSMANVHPFIYDDTALIHNGTIRNAFTMVSTVSGAVVSKGLDVNKISTCDSEAALQTYLSNKVGGNFDNQVPWLKMLEGGYVFGVIGRDENNQRIIDVVRGSSFLYEMDIEGLGKVFTTDNDDAIAVVKEMGLNWKTEVNELTGEVTVKSPKLVTYNTMRRFNPFTGEQINYTDINKVEVTHTVMTYTNKGTNGQNSSGKSGSSNSSGKNKSTLEVSDFYPEFLTAKGAWDTAKVAAFCKDSNEDFLDRLYLFDEVHGTNFADEYEILDSEIQYWIKMKDKNEGFKEARSEILELVDIYVRQAGG